MRTSESDVLLRFGNVDFDELREGDWLNLEDDLATLLCVPQQLDAKTGRWHRLEGFTRNEIREAARLARCILPLVARTVRLARAVDRGDEPPSQSPLLSVELKRAQDEAPELGLTVAFVGSRHDGRSFQLACDVHDIREFRFELSAHSGRITVAAPLRERFIFAVGSILARLEVERVRQCPACATFFYAEDLRSEFCMRRCANREMSRRKREHNTDETKALSRRRARKSYEGQKKKELGLNVQVGTRRKGKQADQ